MHHFVSALCCVLLLGTANVRAADEGTDEEKAEVAAATQSWVEAFNARDAERIAALYAPEAVFWGTVSKTIRTTPAAVLEYFQASVANGPHLSIAVVDQHPRAYGEIGINTGAYTSREIRDGSEIVKASRFTFVYRKQDGRWTIIEHHSSRIP